MLAGEFFKNDMVMMLTMYVLIYADTLDQNEETEVYCKWSSLSVTFQQCSHVVGQ